MKSEDLYRKVKTEGLIHLSISDEEELIIQRGENGTYLIQIKIEDNKIITTHFEKISDNKVVPYEDDYKLYLTDPYYASSPIMKQGVVLIKTPTSVFMYDPFLRRFLYNKVSFNEWYLTVGDIDSDDVNLIRESSGLFGTDGNFLLRITTKYRDNLYPLFNKEGRLICIYNNPKKALSMIPDAYFGVNIGCVYEDSLDGDILKLTQLIEMINGHYCYNSESLAHKADTDEAIRNILK